MTNIMSTSLEILLCALKELEKTKSTDIFIERCIHETKKFHNWNKYSFQPFSYGKYGSIGKLYLNGVKVRHDKTSLVVKTNRQAIDSIKLKFFDNIFIVDEHVAELAFASLIKALFESGACPFYVHYFGYFLNPPKMYIFSEKCNFEFSHILKRQKDGLSIVQRIPNLLINCIFQFIYAVYIYKSYFNMVHFDTHIRNVMLETSCKGQYKNLNWSNCKYIIFRDSRTKKAIVIKNYGFIVKILDFGLCFAELSHSSYVDCSLSVRSRICAEKYISTTSKSNTIDIMYFLLHVYQYMNFGLDKNFGSCTTNFLSDRIHYSEMLTQINDFSNFYFGKPFSHFAGQNTPDRNGEGKILYILKNHDVGIENPRFDTVNGLMEQLLNVCKKIGFCKQNCVVDKIFDFEIFSHETIEDNVFNENCLYLDAGLALSQQKRLKHCDPSLQWWSVDSFDKGCRSVQKFSQDCNIFAWKTLKYFKDISKLKYVSVCGEKGNGPCIKVKENIICIEESPSETGLKCKRLSNQIADDSYKQRNFIAETNQNFFIFCFGTHYGGISIAKATSIFSNMGMHRVFELENNAHISVSYKKRTTKISGTFNNLFEIIKFPIVQ
jgi:hypothetical protein